MSDVWAPLHHLSPLLNCLKVALDALQAASREMPQWKQNLVVRVDASNVQFRDTVADLIAKINGRAASDIATVRALCHDRAKVLDAQADKLMVSAGQLAACVKVGQLAVASRHYVGVTRALGAAIGVKQLCKVDLEPRVSAKLDIAADVHEVLGGMEGMAVLRLYDVDGRRSIVSGVGLVSCFRGLGLVNNVKVTCANSAGKAAEWVAVEDIQVMLSKVDGEEIGRRITGQVIGKGEIVIKYEVDDVDVDEVDVSVSVRDVTVSGGPWRVAIMRSAIQAEAVHIKTNILNGKGNYGVAVTLDGLHVIVSSHYWNSISVYSTDSGCCITTFGCFGLKAGQFRGPVRVCATPRGTIFVCDYGNKRLQEVTITGEHVRCIGEGHFDDEGVVGICVRGDIVAVGKNGGRTDGRIVLFSYLSGVLIRKFGSYGVGDDQLENIYGLSFTPNGKHILVAQNFPPRLSLFTVDGAFVTTIGTGVIGRGLNDVLCSGSNIFVSDTKNHRVCVFSSETGALIRTWGMQGLGDGQFMSPSALANHKNKLFVLDTDSPRVQIFE